jgi:hypothetical protein
MPSTPPPALSSLSRFPTPWALCANPGNQATSAAPTAPTSTALQLNCRRLAHLCQQKGIRQEWIVTEQLLQAKREERKSWW